MEIENKKISIGTVDNHEFAIDRLLQEFHANVDFVANDQVLLEVMKQKLRDFNPQYIEIETDTLLPKAEVLSQVVAGVYAPMIHLFSLSLLKNIDDGNLPPNVIVPPRDSIPIAVSLSRMAELKGVDINILTPHINRNVSGISNNQRSMEAHRDPLLDMYFDQQKAKMNGNHNLCEAETGIYGTTSLVMAHEFKKRGIATYAPIKIYGLGPNLSFVHGILSRGKTWVAEQCEASGMVETFMVVLDSMEELGMQNAYKSIESLIVCDEGEIKPVIELNSPEEQEIARVTNLAVYQTAASYVNANVMDMRFLIENIPFLVSESKKGMPFTLTSAIPSMDSREEHFDKIRKSGLFDYPQLKI